MFTQGNSYSTVLLQAGGLLIVMNTQLDKMVIMMNILKYLKHSQGKYGKLLITVSIMIIITKNVDCYQKDGMRRIWMYKNFDGSSSDKTKRTDTKQRWFSCEPVDCVSLAYDNKCLQMRKRLTQRLENIYRHQTNRFRFKYRAHYLTFMGVTVWDWLSVLYKRGRYPPEECWGDALVGHHRSWAGTFLPPDHYSVPVVPPQPHLLPLWCSSPGWAFQSPPVTLGWICGTHLCLCEGAGLPSWHREEIPPQRGISTPSSWKGEKEK